MKCFKFIKKTLVSFLVLVVFGTHVLFAYSPETSFWKEGHNSTNVGSLLESIPLNKAMIQEIYRSKDEKTSPILLIQDIHLNLEAQTNIASILQTLINLNRVGMVGVEGAFDQIDFEPFRSIPDNRVVKEVVEAYFNNSRISAPSYVGITSHIDPPPFLGVDDKKHYTANVNAYLSSRDKKPEIKRRIKEAKSHLDFLKTSVYSPHLKRFDEASSAYRKGKIRVGAYLEKLAAYPVPAGLMVTRFLEAYRLESSLDFNRAEREKRLFSDQIQAKILFREIEDLETRIRSKLITMPKQKQLTAKTDALYLTEKLIDFSLTPNDWKKYKALNLEDSSLSVFENFYREADIRSHKMVNNLLGSGTQGNRVLILGGFHTALVTSLLQKKGIPYVVVTPKITKIDSESGTTYLSTFSHEKTPLDTIYPTSQHAIRSTAVQLLASLKARLGTLARFAVVEVKFRYQDVLVALKVHKNYNAAKDTYDVVQEFITPFLKFKYRVSLIATALIGPIFLPWNIVEGIAWITNFVKEEPTFLFSLSFLFGGIFINPDMNPISAELDEASVKYQEEVSAAVKEHGRTDNWERRNSMLYAAYHEFIGTLTRVLDRERSICIYPVPGPDISFQIYSDTFVLNQDYPDFLFGREFLVEAGILGDADWDHFEDDIIFQRLLSGQKLLDAYNLENYSNIKRNNKKFVLIMKGFMNIAKHYLSPTDIQDFLKILLRNNIKPGDQIVVFTKNDHDMLERVSNFDEDYSRLYLKDDLLEEAQMISKGGFPVKTVLIPNFIAVYERFKTTDRKAAVAHVPPSSGPGFTPGLNAIHFIQRMLKSST